MYNTAGRLAPNKARCQPQAGLALFDAWLIVEGTICDDALGASLTAAVVSALNAAGAAAPQATMLACKVPLRNKAQATDDPADRNSEYSIRFASASVNASLVVADALNDAGDACRVLSCGPAVILAKGAELRAAPRRRAQHCCDPPPHYSVLRDVVAHGRSGAYGHPPRASRCPPPAARRGRAE